MKILESEILSKHNTFRTGGPARFFIEVSSVDELSEAVAFARDRKLPFFILGEGSNILVNDDGFAGVVIRPLFKGITFSEESSTGALVVAGAGEHWDDLVAQAVAKNLSGLENLSAIPGSVGAAPVQDIGAYGTELKDVLEWVEVFDSETDTPCKLSNSECSFGYRHSIFKSVAGRKLIITRVAMRLRKNAASNISYKDLQKYFAGVVEVGEKTSAVRETPSIAEVREAVIEIRRKKLPDVTKIGTAGSFFKNPIITEVEYRELAQKFPGLTAFDAGPGLKKIPLAWILDKVCHLNGHREGNVGLYDTQPLALVNFGGATTVEVENLAKKIAKIVKEKTGLQIEWEVNKI